LGFVYLAWFFAGSVGGPIEGPPLDGVAAGVEVPPTFPDGPESSKDALSI